ncbi:MAG: cysteine desulfurase [Flavobacteriales bacterium]|jgi:cysteine desulfurase / selenocysteine lyase|nr:cysteine desulfurase [Flavobacteriales bacterium]
MNDSIEQIRNDFPILNQKVNGKPLIYFDNGATTQKPSVVMDAISQYYNEINSNVHRGVHHLSQVSTEKYEYSRDVVQQFIGAKSREEIVFSKGTTDAINIVASSWTTDYLNEGDEIIISTMEHHSNIVPWQMACKKKKAKLIVAPINNQGELLVEKLKEKVNNRTKLISITHISNTLGTINPIEEIIAFAKTKGIAVLIDAAQSVAHMKIDVKALDCDFLVFSGHKLFGPTGTGVLYAKKKWLDRMPPYQGGGDMIKEVSFEKTTYNDPPHKFEAGTPNISGVIGMATAIEYVQNVGFKFIQQQEQELLSFATNEMLKIDEIEIIGTANSKASVISFLVKGTHPFDVGTILDQLGIAIRTGHHCTQPLMNFYNIPGTARISFSFYNSIDEIKHFIKALKKVISMLN